MNNPRIIVILSGIAALYLGYSIFVPGDEAPSGALNALNWVLFLMAIVGCIGSAIQIARGKQ